MSLEPGLIDRLQARYPTLNVAEIALGCETADNPSAALTARCKAAAKASAADSQSRKPEDAKPEHWTSTGAWTSVGQRDAMLSSFLNQVWKIARDRACTPRTIAMMAEVNGVALAFPNRSAWLDPPHDDCVRDDWWHSVPTSSGAEEWVKRTVLTAAGKLASPPVDPIEASRMVAEAVERLYGVGTQG